MKGGELLDKILRQKFFSEREASAVLYTITKTVHYLHCQGVRKRSTWVRGANVFSSDAFPVHLHRWYTATWNPVTSSTWMTREIPTLSGYVTLDLLSSFGAETDCSSPPVTLPTLWHRRWGGGTHPRWKPLNIKFVKSMQNLLTYFLCVSPGTNAARLRCSLWHLEFRSSTVYHASRVRRCSLLNRSHIHTYKCFFYRRLCTFHLFCFRYTPFANGPNDTPEEILLRIGSGKFSLTGGNWDTVSDTSKVQVSSFFFQIYVLYRGILAWS